MDDALAKGGLMHLRDQVRHHLIEDTYNTFRQTTDRIIMYSRLVLEDTNNFTKEIEDNQQVIFDMKNVSRECFVKH